MLTVLGGLAEFERELIRARTQAGIKRARQAGIRFGRPPKLIKHQQAEAMRLLDAGEPQSAVAAWKWIATHPSGQQREIVGFHNEAEAREWRTSNGLQAWFRTRG
jgi:DNA invertase Pin-like site-specific DNA recombinase